MTSDTRPTRVTIGMPVRNGADYLEAALQSIRAQTFDDWKLLISDNASTDATEAICRDFAAQDPRISYHRRRENVGAARNYNDLVHRAQGEYFKWAAHDDLIAPTYLSALVQALDDNPEASLAFSHIRYIGDRGTILRDCTADLGIRASRVSDRALRFVDLVHQGDDIFWAVFGLTRLDALRRTRLIAPYVASDQALMFHLAMEGTFELVPEVLFLRREHVGASMALHTDPASRARWFDSRAGGAPVLPNWQLLVDHAKIVAGREEPLLERARTMRAVARRFRRKWRHLGGELAGLPPRRFQRSTTTRAR